MLKAYWTDEKHGLTVYHADCREIMARLPDDTGTVITDPVWPNALAELPGAGNPQRLFTQAGFLFPRLAHRVVVHLGCDSDPRFLEGVPKTFPFLRSCTLDYARPHYKGRILYGNDVAYVFGEPPPSKPGAHVLPGRCWHTDAGAAKHADKHPCERRLQHVQWLVQWFTTEEETVYDPFCGRATTLVASYNLGRRAVGIEVCEKFCEQAVARLEADIQRGRLWEPSELKQKPKQEAFPVD